MVVPNSFEMFRDQLQPALADSIDKPQGIIAVNVICAEKGQAATRIWVIAGAT